MANMRAVVMAAPSSSVQTTACISGTCWSSGAAGGSVPVTRLQQTRISFPAASTAISPVASFSARLARLSPFSAIGIPGTAATRRGHPRRPMRTSISQRETAPAGLAPPPPPQDGKNYQVRQAWRLSLAQRSVLAAGLARRRFRQALLLAARHQQRARRPAGQHARSGHTRPEQHRPGGSHAERDLLVIRGSRWLAAGDQPPASMQSPVESNRCDKCSGPFQHPAAQRFARTWHRNPPGGCQAPREFAVSLRRHLLTPLAPGLPPATAKMPRRWRGPAGPAGRIVPERWGFKVPGCACC